MHTEILNKMFSYHKAEPGVDVWTGTRPALSHWPKREVLNIPTKHTLYSLLVHTGGVQHF